MATQQHPAFDPNQPLVAAELPRNAGWKKDYAVGVAAQWKSATTNWARRRFSKRSRGELDADGKIAAIRSEVEGRRRSIEAKLVEIARCDVVGKKLTGDAEILLGRSNALRQALQQTKLLCKVRRSASGSSRRIDHPCRARTQRWRVT